MALDWLDNPSNDMGIFILKSVSIGLGNGLSQVDARPDSMQTPIKPTVAFQKYLWALKSLSS